jgi:hypothetical protein
MDQELQVYYEESFSTFATKGWGFLIEDFKKLREAVNDLSTVPDPNQLMFRKGQLDILDLILNRKAMCEKTWEELQNEENL